MGDTPLPHRSRARSAFLVLSGVLALLIAVGSGFRIQTIRHVEANILKLDTGPACKGAVCLVHVTPQCYEHACNYLILGSDSRKGVPKSFGSTQSSPGQR